jgi:four helix bundle protein
VRSGFRDLVAYRRATELAHQLHRAIAAWPKFERWELGMQLLRAADSIGANIAEASGRHHQLDRRHLLVVARGSLHEVEHWLATAEARGLLRSDALPDLTEIARTLEGLITKQTPS